MLQVCLLLTISLLSVFLNQCYSKSITIPGVSPHSYKEYENVKLFVTKVTSTKTQIPYDYYKLPYCKPKSQGN